MAPGRSHTPSERVQSYLARGETVALEMRQHWARTLPSIAAAVVGLILVLVAGFAAPGWMGWLTNAAWWIWLVLLGNLIYHVIDWHHETFVVTNRRLILVHGLFVKKVAMMPLSKVTDMSYNRSPVARLLGYGTFVLESAGQDQALSEINFVKNPDARYRDICGLIFDGDYPSETPELEDEDYPVNEEPDEPVRVRYSDRYQRENQHLDERTQEIPSPYNYADDWDDEWDADPDGHDGYNHPESEMVTNRSQPMTRDLDHSYSGASPADGAVASDEESAWAVSREHATRPQTVRSRHLDSSARSRDGE